MREDTERLRKRFGSDVPELSTLIDQTSLIFVNQHFSFAGPRPLPPNVVEIGGVHIKQSRKLLPDDLQQLLDNAKHGVIYVSWGSIINSEGMPLGKRQEIVKAFKRLPQMVLWKWSNDSLTATAKNVHIRSWLPQIDILCHPNVKVFMSHGGLMGTTEGNIRNILRLRIFFVYQTSFTCKNIQHKRSLLSNAHNCNTNFWRSIS